VNFLQNHDQIGNRPLGDRLTTQADHGALAAALAIMLLAPMPPLLYMGEEWDSQKPFPFFCDFQGDLAEAVRAGRRKEFRDAYERHGEDIPDPLAEATFQAAKLDWESCAAPAGQTRLALVRDLLRARRQHVVPQLVGARFGNSRFDGDILSAHWLLGNSSRLALLANLGAQERAQPAPDHAGSPIWGGEPPDILPPWSVYWSVGDA
jgi:maltooligosyltrehalose trehalohydrolase